MLRVRRLFDFPQGWPLRVTWDGRPAQDDAHRLIPTQYVRQGERTLARFIKTSGIESYWRSKVQPMIDCLVKRACCRASVFTNSCSFPAIRGGAVLPLLVQRIAPAKKPVTRSTWRGAARTPTRPCSQTRRRPTPRLRWRRRRGVPVDAPPVELALGRAPQQGDAAPATTSPSRESATPSMSLENRDRRRLADARGAWIADRSRASSRRWKRRRTPLKAEHVVGGELPERDDGIEQPSAADQQRDQERDPHDGESDECRAAANVRESDERRGQRRQQHRESDARCDTRRCQHRQYKGALCRQRAIGDRLRSRHQGRAGPSGVDHRSWNSADVAPASPVRPAACAGSKRPSSTSTIGITRSTGIADASRCASARQQDRPTRPARRRAR